ncbi:hypothetical protein MMC22_004049 [Lobaria immixta]|nr:hypothetical protein [Lobaria immixta]
MKFRSILEAAGLLFLASGISVMASPVEEVNDVLEDSVAARSLNRLKQEAGYQSGTIEVVAQLVSELVAVQIVGAATSQDQLHFLCNSFSYSRLAGQFYNVTLMQNIICAGAKPTSLTPLPLIRNLTTEVSTEIWIVQAIGAVQGNIAKLCEIIDVDAATAIGLTGTLVKKDVCAAAAVASKVAKSGGTTAVTLTAPLVTSIAPLSELTLPFVQVTPTPTATPKP